MKKILLILVLMGLINASAQKKKNKIAEGVIFSQDIFNKSMRKGVSCFRIPAIVTAPNGDLIAAIDERVPSCGDLKWSKDINIVIRRSRDNGQTWSDIETVADFPYGKSASDPSMIVDKITEEIFLFYNYMDLDTEKDIYYLHVVKSADNGKSWCKPEDITAQITKPEWHEDFKFITSGRGIQTSTGKLLHCMVNLNSGMHLFASDNHGKSWYLIDTPVKPANESKVVELVDGSWMVNARINGKGLRSVHISMDKGKTWESKLDSNLIDPGCNGSIIRYTSIKDGYKKNRLLFSNAKMKKGRKNMTVRISYDEGKSWSEGKIIYTGKSAYSSLTILKNGDIGLFFEKDGYKENPFVSFTLEWLTDGKDKYQKPKTKFVEPEKIGDIKTLFKKGDYAYACFRIPAVVVTNDGSILAFAEARKYGCSDTGNIDIVLRKSTDNGKTWGELIVVWDDGGNVCGNPAPVVDKETGVIHLLTTWNSGKDHESQIINGTSSGTREVFHQVSKDDGESWSAPKNISKLVKLKDWTWYATGPVHGIQLKKGKTKGRLVIPCDHIEAKTKKYYSHIIYSDDHGLSWKLGGRTPNDQVNECTVVELQNGDLMLNMRNYQRKKMKARQVAISRDGGINWENQHIDTELPEPRCQAAILSVKRKGKNVLLFTNPAHPSKRKNMTLSVSRDQGDTWKEKIIIFKKHAAYSDLVELKNGKIFILFEGGNNSAYNGIHFKTVSVQ